MNRWLSAAGGAILLAIAAQILLTLDALPVQIELNPAAVEMWKVLLDFVASTAWPLVVGVSVILFAPQIRELIPRLRKFKTPIFSGELNPNIPFRVGELEGERKATPAQVTKDVALDRRRDQLYGAINDAVGEIGNAVLVALEYIPKVTMMELGRGLSTNTSELKQAFRRLFEHGLAWKERPGVRAEVTQVGRAYLEWLREARPDAFNRARSRWTPWD